MMGPGTIQAAVLHELGAPACDDFAAPVAGPGEEVLTVLAAGINHLDVGIARGLVPLLLPPLPCVVGSDGVGLTSDGRRVYFERAVAPYGSLAEQTLVRSGATFDVIDDVDDATAAALGNAGLAAMVSVGWHAELQPGDRVVVLGATGAVGRLAVQIAHLDGAKSVVAVGRDPERLSELTSIGAAATVLVDSPTLAQDITEAAGGPVDVIIDNLWGEPALAAIEAAAFGARLCQVGDRAGQTINLRAGLVRSKGLRLHGIAGALEPLERQAPAYARLLELAARGAISVKLETVPLRQIEEAWHRQESGPETKLVAIP